MYQHASAGSLCSALPSDVCSRTDARGLVTTYKYIGPLSRITSKSYSDGTPSTSYTYDAAPNGSGVNTVGRMTSEKEMQGSDVINQRVLSGYDAMGRLQAEADTLPIAGTQTSMSWTYGYNLAGDLAASNSSNGQLPFQASFRYDTVGRLSSVPFQTFTTPGGQTYLNETLFTATGYSPWGGISSASIGTNSSGGPVIRELRTYNNYRGWLYSMEDKSLGDNTSYADIFYATYTHNNNNNLHGATETATGNWAAGGPQGAVVSNWVYGYDYQNRVTTANSSGSTNNYGTLSFTYDRYGNRWQETGGTQSFYASFNNTHNRVDAGTYDASGNLLHDPSGLQHTYTYDAENRLTGITDQGITYTYDAEGRRMAEYTSGAQTKSYARDNGGNAVLIFDSAGGVNTLDLFAAGRHLLEWNQGYWGYPVQDILGTTKEVITDPAGWLVTRCTNLPFGDGLACDGVDQNPFHFTGKERDAESGLDYFGARFYASSMGRFMSPDEGADATLGVPVPFAELENPQSLNLYSYVVNNPLRFTDPDGQSHWGDCNDGSGA